MVTMVLYVSATGQHNDIGKHKPSRKRQAIQLIDSLWTGGVATTSSKTLVSFIGILSIGRNSMRSQLHALRVLARKT